MLESAWKHVGKKGKAIRIDGVKAEDILTEKNGVEKFLTTYQQEFKTKGYYSSPVKQVYIPKVDGAIRPSGPP